MPVDEEALLRACARGESKARAALYERYRGRVYGLAVRLLGDRTEAEDAAQDVFVRLFERAASYRGASSVSTWIYRVTVNHCLNLLRRRRLLRILPLPARAGAHVEGNPVSPQVESAERSEEIGRLHEALGALPPKLRAAVVLRDLEGLSHREIARVLGVPEGTVMSRIARGRARLRARFGAPRPPQ